MIPNVFSWTHAPPRCMHVLSSESYWIRNSSRPFPESRSASLFLFCKALPLPLELQLFPCIFDGFFIVTIFRIDEINASQSSSIIEFWLLDCPLLLLSPLSGFSNSGPDFRPHILRSVPPRTTNIFWSFSSNRVNFVHPFQESDKLRFASTFQ